MPRLLPVKATLTACEEFYGLSARPFSLTPDLRFAYHSRSHTQALEQVKLALKRREGLIVVTGEIGTGKTMLCRSLLETFEARTFLSVVLDPLLTVEDLLQQVLTDFGLITPAEHPKMTAPMTAAARHQLVTTLHQFLSSLVPLDAHAVIMIDEAQHLSPAVLEEVRLLSNFETDEAKLLQIVLVGQPNLEEVLHHPGMRQLNQRVARRLQLAPLGTAEVIEYVEHRLHVAGDAARDAKNSRETSDSFRQARVRFAPEALETVAALSGGTPRLVNTLCDRALEFGFENQEYTIDHKTVLAAAARLKLPVPMAQRLSSSRRLQVAAALSVLAASAAGGLWWSSRRTGGVPESIPIATAGNGAPLVRTQAGQPAAPLPVPAAPPVEAAPAPSGAATPPTAASATEPADPPQGVPSPARAASRSGGYEVTIASFRTEQRARAVTEALAASGLRASTELDSTGQWYRVFAGPYTSTGEAEATQAELARLGFPDTRVFFRNP